MDVLDTIYSKHYTRGPSRLYPCLSLQALQHNKLEIVRFPYILLNLLLNYSSMNTWLLVFSDLFYIVFSSLSRLRSRPCVSCEIEHCAFSRTVPLFRLLYRSYYDPQVDKI
jgi:hypothetical protein